MRLASLKRGKILFTQATSDTRRCGVRPAGYRRMTDQGFAMTNADLDGQATAAADRYPALLAVSEAIASHRDLSALFHELAGRLHQVVRFDYLALLLYEAEGNILRLHVLEPPGPSLPSAAVILPVAAV